LIPGTSVSELDAKQVVKVMETQITHHAQRSSNPIVFYFVEKETAHLVVHRRPITLVGQKHCEAELACLMQFTDRLLSPQNPAYELIKNLNPDIIAVSKLSCPVCYELLLVLRGDAPIFKLRGRHSCMSPVQLPSGLPRDVIQSMISTFRTHLLSAISTMMGREDVQHEKKHKPGRSIESNSGLSVAINVGGEDLKATIWEHAVQPPP